MENTGEIGDVEEVEFREVPVTPDGSAARPPCIEGKVAAVQK